MTERIVEVIADVISARQSVPASWRIEDANKVLAALRDAGFEVYRPEDCEFAKTPDGQLVATIPVVLIGSDSSWVIEPDGAMGPAPDPNIKHHPRCCVSRGCHNICSYSCGTDHAIDPDWDSVGGEG